MTTTALVRMSDAHYQAFMAEAVPAYAADKVASGQWRVDEAPALSAMAFADLLPQGLATPDNHLFSITAGEPPQTVGALWIAAQHAGGRRIAFVYEVTVDAAHRRRGHARRAFVALEREVAALGLAGIALHVFGHNAAARALYAALGYQVTDLNLRKPVAG